MLPADERLSIAGQDAELPEIRRRARLLAILVTLAFVGLATRLFYLQVVEGDAFYKLTSENIVRTVVQPAVRGEIRDRKNRVLARMWPSANVSVLPREVTAEAFQRVAAVLGLGPGEEAEMWDRIESARRDPVADHERPLDVREDVSRKAQAILEESAPDLPGVRLEHSIRRDYPFGALAAHVLGYMNEISTDELRAKAGQDYRPGDLIGRYGIERQFEGYLRGRTGFEKVVINRRSVPKADIRDLVDGPVSRDPIPGNNVFLTLDVDVQRLAEHAFRGNNAGAAVVLDVTTGRILAMVSKPGFDPNEMSGHLSLDAQARLLADRYHPLRDKVVGETYFPGSTFKVVTALAALEDEIVTPDEKIVCHGFVERGARRFKDHRVHGAVSLQEALVQSCNVYFYELGARPGMLDRMARYAIDLGLGAPTGLGLNGDSGGFMPTEEWYKERKRSNPKSEGLVVGQALNTAIGQGSVRTSVLQTALLYAAIANGGKLLLPQLVERIESPTGQVVEGFAPQVRRELSVSPENMAVIRQALVGAVNDAKGTAFRARINEVEVAGKTGTAQVTKLRRRGEAQLPNYNENDHAWFAGFAPAGKPRIAFAVLIEHGGFGGEVAAPVATEMVRRYFDEIAPSEREAPRIGLLRHSNLRVIGSAQSEPVTPRNASRELSRKTR